MKKYYDSSRDYWDSEAEFAKSADVWKVEAYQLWMSAKVIYDQQLSTMGNGPHRYPAFWGWRVVRMLIAFSLENLIKAYLLQKKGKDSEWFAREGNLTIKKGHDLVHLFQEAEYSVDGTEKHYLELFSICGLWAGRYPIAANEHSLPRKRASMSSSEELVQRSLEIHKKYKKDPRMKYGDFWDLLHIGIGNLEYECADRLFRRLLDDLGGL